MSKAEILAELPKLNTDELAEVQAKLDELAGDIWLDGGELTEADKAALDEALVEYRANPDAGANWREVLARIKAKLSGVGWVRLLTHHFAEAAFRTPTDLTSS